ncbi:low molecular weight protein-tyrosine-phosphatase [Malaciobacter mytili]|uniref:protein-tyrosine-phosphatase n=1 Tax=Malaciobacter mytili LMG 24559 TaxID=1032238 RepID=A0AAX2ADI2_9BACT|nr:low molecular weight protein-tyrosine-phosphatase [Malaciobacter mytili]AXH13659.1 low molecular weight protein-tyrosine-phosphatase [Malaciobacter mytili LMG 24559]RXI44657.1 protein tyrosine phosphatase [Malaciobacter mytili]RXK13842.1 protein tyrosine phosphatase [Malaciobacter mytili LMG 24559]
MNKAKSIIFVCLGNICRSPIAQGVAQKYIKENNLDILIQSAGTGSWHVGENPCENSIKVCKQHNIDISKQVARQVKKEDFKKFDLVIGLDESNISNLKKLGCNNPLKLGFFGYNNEDVPDPYFFDGFEGFDKVYSMIETCVIELIKQKC